MEIQYNDMLNHKLISCSALLCLTENFKSTQTAHTKYAY